MKNPEIYAFISMGFLVVLLVIALAVVGTMDHSDAQDQEAGYCEMVEIFRESGGEYGWPPREGLSCE